MKALDEIYKICILAPLKPHHFNKFARHLFLFADFQIVFFLQICSNIAIFGYMLNFDELLSEFRETRSSSSISGF